MHPVPPLASHSLLVFLAAIAVLLAVARLLGRLAERIGMPAIVGELATGVILVPSLLLHVLPGVSHWLFPDANQMHLLDGIAQVSAVLLVGVTGTQLDLGLLRRAGGTALTVSGLNLITPLALGVTLGLFLPATVVASGHASRVVLALFIGVTMCVSALPVIAKTLSDMRLLHRNPGQLILAAGSIDDAVGWLLLSVVSAAATTGVRIGHVLVAVACLIAFVLLAGTVGRVGVKKVLTVTTRADEPGPTVAAAVVIILAGAVTTAALGMEPIFGAFIAGTVISASRIAQRQLAALRTLVLSVLAPLFLGTAGLRVDVTVLARPWSP